ncbi:hypothetical protein ACP70R_001185 [Stipagrostis hirtigluma subsp. patula]
MAGGGAPPSVARLVFLLAAGCCCCFLLLPFPADAARQLASPPPEADALLKFKTGVKDDAGALKSWAPGSSPCNGDTPNWAGVMCSKDGVYGLQLESMGLAGPLDVRPLKPMAGLRTLSVMSNQFSGPMPEVKELSGLRAIFLSDNKFSGEIPADAGVRGGARASWRGKNPVPESGDREAVEPAEVEVKEDPQEQVEDQGEDVPVYGYFFPADGGEE